MSERALICTALSQRARRMRLVACLLLAAPALRPGAAPAELAARADSRSSLIRLCDMYAARIEERFAGEYQLALRDGLADNPGHKQRFLKAFFVFSLVHDQGILGNLWELVDDYPASDRRMPATLFKEAFSGRPSPTFKQLQEDDDAATTCIGYSHGRCDRLEMEFIALMSFLGVKSEMFMSGPIHVRTEVPIGGHYLIFDNSFSRFKLRATPGQRVRPAYPYNVKYANHLALSEAARITALRLDPAASSASSRRSSDSSPGRSRSGARRTRPAPRRRHPPLHQRRSQHHKQPLHVFIRITDMRRHPHRLAAHADEDVGGGELAWLAGGHAAAAA